MTAPIVIGDREFLLGWYRARRGKRVRYLIRTTHWNDVEWNGANAVHGFSSRADWLAWVGEYIGETLP